MNASIFLSAVAFGHDAVDARDDASRVSVGSLHSARNKRGLCSARGAAKTASPRHWLVHRNKRAVRHI
jgi:hypothetical protein